MDYQFSGGNLEFVAVSDGSIEVKWRFFVEIEYVQSSPHDDSYRPISKGGGALPSALTSAQLQTSVSRGATYKARYFRLSGIAAGTTLAIDQTWTGSSWDGYCYLTKGATRGGPVLAYDDDAGGSTNPKIIYTTSAGDGPDLIIECTSYTAGATGTFNISVT
jgi:hypothetical protein